MMHANPTNANNTPRRKKGWIPLVVEDIVVETHDTKTFCFVDAEEGGRPFDFEPGQYLTFRFDDLEAKPIVRSYTMSGSPNSGNKIYVTVKKVEGGRVSSWFIDELKVGTTLRARGPIGHFCCPRRTQPFELCMIAAGSGVTPFVSILREYHDRLGQEGLPHRMSLLTSVRSDDDLICWPSLIDCKNSHVRIEATLSRQNKVGFRFGRISDDMIEDFSHGTFGSKVFMICGPDLMMASVADYLRSRGVAEEDILVESFS